MRLIPFRLAAASIRCNRAVSKRMFTTVFDPSASVGAGLRGKPAEPANPSGTLLGQAAIVTGQPPMAKG